MGWGGHEGAEARIRLPGQRLEPPALVAREASLGGLAGRPMLPDVGDGIAPVRRLGVEVVVADKRAPVEEALPTIANRPLDFALRLRPIRPTGARAKAPVLSKAQELGIHHEPARVRAPIRGDDGPHLIKQ